MREEISYLQATMHFYYITLIFIPLSMLLLSLVNLIEEWHWFRISRELSADALSDPIRVVLPFKDQASADIVRTQLKDLRQKIHTTVQTRFCQPED